MSTMFNKILNFFCNCCCRDYRVFSAHIFILEQHRVQGFNAVLICFDGKLCA